MNAFKNNVILGCATSATQIEGGDTNNSWYEWYKKGKIKDNSDPCTTQSHYENYKEDILLLEKLNVKIYRMGIEWSRIQPERNVFDHEVILHYRDEISLMKEKGIEVLVTLHHFTNPIWFEDMGAFLHKDAVDIFLEYVKFVIENLGDLVDEYATINEPNVYALNGYISTLWPPGKFSFFKYAKAMGKMAVCHIKSYELIHAMRKNKNTKVGFAMHLSAFEPKSKYNPFFVFLTWIIKREFITNIVNAMGHGKFSVFLGKQKDIKPGKYCDFFGVNYYSKNIVFRVDLKARKGENINGLGWQVYPQGLFEFSKQMYDLFKVPIYITENGAADNNDDFRSRFIYDHLKAISENEVPIERYYYWSFLDNFEWAEGNTPRFGIVHVDYETQKRTIKKSGEFYSKIIEEGGVSEELYKKYVEGEEYPKAT